MRFYKSILTYWQQTLHFRGLDKNSHDGGPRRRRWSGSRGWCGSPSRSVLIRPHVRSTTLGDGAVLKVLGVAEGKPGVDPGRGGLQMEVFGREIDEERIASFLALGTFRTSDKRRNCYA